MAERSRALFLNLLHHLTAVSGVGSSPALATGQVLIVGVPGVVVFFFRVLSFPPTY